jgi:hypothetical protein
MCCEKALRDRGGELAAESELLAENFAERSSH